MSVAVEVLHRAELEPSRPLTAVEIRAQVNLIQEVMRSVFVKDVHYGQIPGTPKPTLYKAGAEKILATFRLAVDYRVEDLSTHDAIRYRSTAVLTSPSGIALGSVPAEASSDEEKYRWRKPVCQQEFDETPEDRRRKKWSKGKNNSTYQQTQVRMNPADVANTILQMANKRALVAITRQVTAASDIFTQDIEDLPDEVREAVVSDGPPTAPETFRPAPAASADIDAKLETGFAMLGIGDKEREVIMSAHDDDKEKVLEYLRAEVRKSKGTKEPA